MPDQPRVALFVTCLVDLFRPSVGLAAVDLLEAAGCRVELPEPQICCGQPAFNSGDRHTTEALARQFIPALEPYDYVVAPSGSCAGMLRTHLGELFDGDPAWKARATALAAATSSSPSSSTCAGCAASRAGSPRASPITTAARACGSSG